MGYAVREIQLYIIDNTSKEAQNERFLLSFRTIVPDTWEGKAMFAKTSPGFGT